MDEHSISFVTFIFMITTKTAIITMIINININNVTPFT